VSGVTYAWNDVLIRRIITTMATMSFFVLPFLGLMPVIAADNLGMDVRSLAYGLLYAAFGTGAALGAVSIGTFLVGKSKARLVRVGFLVFAALLAAFGLCRVPALAYAIVPLMGFAYFGTVTSMSTILQQHLDDRIRGRIMALWIMAFGGTVPLGTLAAGPIADHASITAVVVGGAVVAAALACYADFGR
jgi:predicted MFS family arabinose efflux permease